MIKSRVGTKIGLGFGLALAILVVIGGVSYRGTVRLTDTAALVEHTHGVLQATMLLNDALIDCETGQRGYIITGEESYLQPYQAASVQVAEHVRRLSELTQDNDRQQRRLAVLEPLVDARLARLQEGIDVRRAQGFEAAQAWVRSGAGKEQMDKIRALIDETQNEENARLRERSEAAAATASDTRLVVALGTLGAFVVLAVAGVLITRNIAGPLTQISSTAGRIAAGDLDADVVTMDRADEVGILAQTFKRMTESLRKMAEVAERIAAGDLRGKVEPQSDKDVLGTAFASMVDNLRRLTGEIAESVNVLGTSANQISTSTTQFAASATETATAVGETTTTVEEVRQTAEVSSQKARAVSDTAQKVAQVSQAGRKATEESLEGMNRIRRQMESIAESMMRLSERSQAIGQIVATVEDLAAQSNLLAVNAAIEAAKAGEQGKGFSVVAQEVKSLADQSRHATGQVRTILNDIQKATAAAVMATEQGTKAVEAGVRQSAQAGQSIQTLAASVAEAAQAATQIAASSQQQLVGVDQVASAMESIKQASLQNVDGARQLEAAAHDLKQLGERLKQLVHRYKV